MKRSRKAATPEVVSDPVESAQSTGLRYVSDTQPGTSLTRATDGYGFVALSVWVIACWACSPSSAKLKAPDWRRVPVSIELRLAEGAPAPGLIPAAVYGQSDTVYLHSEVVLSNRDIARVEAAKTMSGSGLVLKIWHTKAGAERITDVTAHHIGDSLAILVDSVVISVPIIEETLNLGTKLPSHIGVPLGPEEARQLARAISETWPAAPRKEAR